MRRSELAGVDRKLLDLDGGSLVIADTRVVVDGRAEDSDGKSDAGVCTIALDPFTVAALRKHMAMLDDEQAAFGASYPRHGKLMCFEDGRRLHPDTVTRRFNRLVDLAGVRPIRLHDIRHTYTTLAMDEGINPKIVSDRVDHANVTVTQQIYTHRSVGWDREAAAALADLIE
jgi:integrase